jgi:VLRF1 release factor-like protein
MTEVHRVRVAPERLQRWLAGFADRHPGPRATATPDAVELTSPDGARARLEAPWGPPAEDDPLAALIAQVTRPRRVGALLVRRNSHAVGLFDGNDLVLHRVGRHYVQGRTKAGGWSQQRYARRRGNQAERAFDKAARDAAELLLPAAATLDAILLGGDAQAVRVVLADPALAELRDVHERHRRPLLAVADPNLQVLRDALPRFLAVTIQLNAEAMA